MEGRTLAIAAYNTKLDDDFEIVADGPDGAREDRGGDEARSRRASRRDMDPFVAGAADGHRRDRRGSRELRDWLEALVEASYQATGYRRVKNPRIWSLHDLAVLIGGVR